MFGKSNVGRLGGKTSGECKTFFLFSYYVSQDLTPDFDSWRDVVPVIAGSDKTTVSVAEDIKNITPFTCHPQPPNVGSQSTWMPSPVAFFLSQNKCLLFLFLHIF